MNSDLQILIKAIVAGQQQIIGPMAIDQANRVPGIQITQNLDSVNVTGDSNNIIENLVQQYSKLFGLASVEACKDSVKKILPQIQPTSIPTFLK